jgi:hypothetical protein
MPVNIGNLAAQADDRHVVSPDSYLMRHSRIEAVQSYAGARVQYTNLMLPPRDIEAYLEGDQKPIKIDSKAYFKVEKSLADLMIAVRGSAKILDGLGAAYAEQYALHHDLLRLVVERQQLARAMRNSPPKYLIDFARLMESLGCDRNHLRSVDGKLVRLIRERLGLDDGDDASADAEARRFRAWWAEEGSLAESEDSSENELDRLSKVAAKALRSGDLDAARSAFADLEAYDTSLEDEFGSDGPGDAADENTDEDLVEAGPAGSLAETDGTATAGSNKAKGDGPSGADADEDIAGRAGTAEGDGGVSSADVSEQDSGSADGQKGAAGATPASPETDAVPSPKVTAIPTEPRPETRPEDVLDPQLEAVRRQHQ